MPLVNLRVDDATRALWVEAAGRESITLSEWLRKAADARLGLADRFVDMPMRLTDPDQLTKIANSPLSQAQMDQGAEGINTLTQHVAAQDRTLTAGENPEDAKVDEGAAPQESKSPPQIATGPPAPAANAPTEFKGPDLKPVSAKKKRR